MPRHQVFSGTRGVFRKYARRNDGARGGTASTTGNIQTEATVKAKHGTDVTFVSRANI
jgi:hypothetical protein